MWAMSLGSFYLSNLSLSISREVPSPLSTLLAVRIVFLLEEFGGWSTLTSFLFSTVEVFLTLMASLSLDWLAYRVGHHFVVADPDVLLLGCLTTALSPAGHRFLFREVGLQSRVTEPLDQIDVHHFQVLLFVN